MTRAERFVRTYKPKDWAYGTTPVSAFRDLVEICKQDHTSEELKEKTRIKKAEKMASSLISEYLKEWRSK